MKFLVTGGAGFIGSNIVEELLKIGHEVRIIDNFSTGKIGNIINYIKDIELIEGDIRDYHIVSKAVSRIEIILHQAALPSVPRSIANPISSNDVNINGTLNLLNAAKEEGITRFIAASSSSIYGDTVILPKHEGMEPNPLSPYAIQKLTLEYYLKVFYELYGLETLALRYFNVFGPKQNPDSYYSAVIPKFIKKMMMDEQPVIFGDGTQSRDFTYIENVINANILAATKSRKFGKVVNVACNEQITLLNLVSKINNQLGKKIEPIFEKPRAGDIKHSFATINLAKDIFEYEPSVRFDEGIKKTITYLSSRLK